jgi:Ca-activated chloride channel family protein
MRSTTTLAALTLALVACQQAPTVPPEAPDPGIEPDPPAATEPREIEIDLDQAVKVELPKLEKHLEPAAFRAPDGQEGWAIRIPGNRPIATPAYADGLLFVGGGYGSHEFYAFHADTGKLAWQIRTSDDGPTAAVVEDGLVAFNTESCTVIVVEAKTGKLVWQEWLGDPLMSQPTIKDGRLYIAYPAGQRPNQNQTAFQSANGDLPARGHRLLCADLRTGKHIWETAITGDVISAPVVDGDRLYMTCFDGTSFCMEAADGKVVWRKENAGTSAPLVVQGEVLMTLKAKSAEGGGYEEGIARIGREDGETTTRSLMAKGDATHLKREHGGGVAMQAEQVAALDSSVGFATAPGAASLDAASANVGVSSVVGGWAYQGARTAYMRDHIGNAQGLYLNYLHASGRGGWRATARGEGFTKGVQAFSPPALGLRDNLYLASARGHLLSVQREDGEVGFNYAFGRPIVFQPALAKGNVYAGTLDGLLICLKTGDPDADDWSMWGGDAQHNKSR